MAKTLVQVNTDTALDLSNEIEQFNSRFNSFINSLQSEDRENHLETINLIKSSSRLAYDNELDYIKDQVAAKKEREDIDLTAKAEEPPLTQPKAEPITPKKEEPNIFEQIATAAAGAAVFGSGETEYTSLSSGMFNTVEYITGDVTYKGNGRNFYVDIAGHGLPSNYHDHVACSTVEDKERAKTALRAAGIQIGSEYREGSRGYHGKNLAFDVPGNQWGGSGAIGQKEFAGSKKVRQILGIGAFAKGGRIHKPIIALIGKKGSEFVFDADTTRGLDKLAPQLLEKLNFASTKPQLASILQSYASYDTMSPQTIVVQSPSAASGSRNKNSSGGGVTVIPIPVDNFTEILAMIG